MSGYESDMWRKSQCCEGARDEIVQLLLGDETIGLVGLNQIFEQLYVLGQAPDASVQHELLKMVAAKNYIPPKAEAKYASGLMREYAKFCAKKEEQSERQTSTR